MEVILNALDIHRPMNSFFKGDLIMALAEVNVCHAVMVIWTFKHAVPVIIVRKVCLLRITSTV